MLAFTDSSDGYYQHDGDTVPKWAEDMTPCSVRPSPITILTYAQQRVAEYAPQSETLDAQTKIRVGTKNADPVMVAAGQAQLDSIDVHNMAVKAKYPKV